MSDLETFRAGKDNFFGTSGQSPIPREARDRFAGLAYYPENPDLVFTLDVTPGDGSLIEVQTSDGQVRQYERSGHVSFPLRGETVEVTLFTTPGHGSGFFVPFRDATSGKETYGAGRYLDVDPNDDGSVTIDFNYAYNPYCAYNEAYSCPLPPVENWLSQPIEAGEKSFVIE